MQQTLITFLGVAPLSIKEYDMLRTKIRAYVGKRMINEVDSDTCVGLNTVLEQEDKLAIKNIVKEVCQKNDTEPLFLIVDPDEPEQEVLTATVER